MKTKYTESYHGELRFRTNRSIGKQRCLKVHTDRKGAASEHVGDKIRTMSLYDRHSGRTCRSRLIVLILSPAHLPTIRFLSVWAISPSDSAHYAHTDLSCITMELWKIPILFIGGGCNNFTYDKIALLFGVVMLCYDIMLID